MEETIQGSDGIIGLESISGPILCKIIKWADHHQHDLEDMDPETIGEKNPNSHFSFRIKECEIPVWDRDFIESLEEQELYALMNACNFLNVHVLLAFCCKMVAARIRGKSVEQVRHLLHIQSDYTKQEEEKLQKENAWAED